MCLQASRWTPSNVDHTTYAGMFRRRSARRGNNVVHVGEVTSLLAVSEDGEFIVVQRRFAKSPKRHVWALARSVNREETQGDELNCIVLSIRLTELLAR